MVWNIGAVSTKQPASPSTGYQVTRSLRFNPVDTPGMSRTFGAPTDRNKWTLSLWLKRSAFGTTHTFFGVDPSGVDDVRFRGTNVVSLVLNSAFHTNSVALYRDPTAWMHVVASFGGTASGTSLSVNGTVVGTAATTDGASNINTAIVHHLGRVTASQYFDGYMADVIFVDGQVLAATSFGETDALTGAWVPKQYTGVFGNNGFRLSFGDNSSAAALGTDVSGRGNHWTPSGFSVTAGIGNDSLIDTPNNYGTDNGIGGEARGNYCTLNPLDQNLAANIVVSNGGLTAAGAGGAAWGCVRGTTWLNSGKWYFEVTTTTINGIAMIGIMGPSLALANASNIFVGQPADGFAYASNLQRYNSGAPIAYGGPTAWAAGDVIGVAMDLDAGTLGFYKNNISLGIAYAGIPAGFYAPAVSAYNSPAGVQFDMNFGQRPFAAVAPPIGYKTICSQSLPTPTIKRGDDYMIPHIRTGTGAVFSVTGKRFQPNIIWFKSRSLATDNALYNSIRGGHEQLLINTTGGITNEGATAVQSFNADGYTGGTGSGTAPLNTAAATYVDFLFKESAIAGVASFAFTSNASGNQAVPHGLGVKPDMVITKARVGINNFSLWHKGLANASTSFLALNLGAAAATFSTMWGAAGHDATNLNFTVGGSLLPSSLTLAAAFAAVPGYSHFGSYVGNANAEGPFVWCGFRPRWLLTKDITATGNWLVVDSVRDTINPVSNAIVTNDAAQAELTGTARVDFLANGFKVRSTSTPNVSGSTYIFAAFAERPFKYARAR